MSNIPTEGDADSAALRAIRSRRVADVHFVSERTNDADEILLSMKSYDPLCTAVIMDPPGSDPVLVLNDSIALQREFYSRSRKLSHIVDAEIFTSVGGGWYGFVHLLLTHRTVEDGTIGVSDVIGLLPTSPDEDTIAGEMGWAKPAYARSRSGDDVPRHRVESARTHESWLAAARDADASRLAELYSDRALGAIRAYPFDRHAPFRGRAEVEERYTELFASVQVEAVDVVLRIVDDWYILAELRWQTSQLGVLSSFSTADILLIDDDNLIRSHVGYGTDPTDVTSSV
jgi:hypothetical protein